MVDGKIIMETLNNSHSNYSVFPLKEVLNMLRAKYSYKDEMRVLRQEAMEEGLESGLTRGIKKGIA